MLITLFFPNLQMFVSESSHFILNIEEPLDFLSEHHETGCEDLPQQKSRAHLSCLRLVVPESGL